MSSAIRAVVHNCIRCATARNNRAMPCSVRQCSIKPLGFPRAMLQAALDKLARGVIHHCDLLKPTLDHVFRKLCASGELA